MSKAKRAGLLFVFVWFALGGLGHFMLTPLFVSIVPPSIPYPAAAVLVSGVFELLGALGVLWLPTRRAAGYGLALLTLAVTPANVYMWQHPELFPKIPPSLLGIRLVVQVLLLVCILWSTSKAGESRDAG
ncbi:DoxX family protein [Cupriavidus basilensis]|uniref:DoxX family protein n=1 Tax=Cupriavidus basilensis TaxID=68895 RepID=UPI0020A65378|nr:hypothetical protein [Cupriavidus basilensis]MCP3020129.1 hypothetical protein [Cupriavidus basilensis]MDR3380343.1 hypothetical protein [Cupriavidus basilensis]